MPIHTDEEGSAFSRSFFVRPDPEAIWRQEFKQTLVPTFESAAAETAGTRGITGIAHRVIRESCRLFELALSVPQVRTV